MSSRHAIAVEIRGAPSGERSLDERRHGAVRIALWIAAVVVLLACAVSIALDPVASWATRRALNAQPGFRGTFDSVSVSLVKLSYRISGLTIEEVPQKSSRPMAVAEQVTAWLSWRDLLHFRVSGEARIEGAKVNVVFATPEEIKAAVEQGEKIATMHGLGRLILGLFPFRLSRAEVRNTELTVIDETQKGVPLKSAEIWMHKIEATFENFASRVPLAEGQPTTIALRGELQHGGELSIFLSADPFADQADFMGELTLKHLDLKQLYGFIASSTGLQPSSGTVDAFLKFHCSKGYFKGTVKPVVENVKIAPAQNDVGKKVEAGAVNAAAGLVSDRVPGRHAIAAVVPIEGPLQNLRAEVWPALLTALRNAYVAALPANFSQVPLKTAPEPQSPLKQASEGLSKKSFPMAQPTGESK